MFEVGNLIRINGIIGRVEQIGNSLFWLEDGSSYSLSDKAVKYSKNIIDLIEVGDIVNNGYIYEIGNTEDGYKWVHNLNGLLLFEKDIKTILTHEQYQANCYTAERKVEE